MGAQGGHLGTRVDEELQLGLLAVVHRDALPEDGGEAEAGAAADAVEDEQAQEAGAVICDLPDVVDDLIADSVVAPGVVGDHLLGVEEIVVHSGTDLVDEGGLQVEEEGPENVKSAPITRFHRSRQLARP